MVNKKLESMIHQNEHVFTFSFLIFYFSFLIFLSSCSLPKKISHSAKQVINDSALQKAHVGISIYEPQSGKYWYDYNGEKYFVPGSNTKILTCYAAMKYLGDSLIGLRYGIPEENKNIIVIQPTGDPTFWHSDFKRQPVFDFLYQKLFTEKLRLVFMDTVWKDQRWGIGWSWTDYEDDYMAERSSFPVYGNVVNIRLKNINDGIVPDTCMPFKTNTGYFDSIVNTSIINKYGITRFGNAGPGFTLHRTIGANDFYVKPANIPFISNEIPFVTDGAQTTLNILNKELGINTGYAIAGDKKTEILYKCDDCESRALHVSTWHTIYSQPTDSLLKPMMHRSDNFFAEQSLLMVSNKKLTIMNDEMIIDTLLQTDLKGLPQKPRWVDGSGLSRYNLFTPQDFVFILTKIKDEFGMDRVKLIFPTGGEGTLGNYYLADKDHIYAKTGSLSGVISLSGYLYTQKGKLLIFSVLVNNHRASATAVRKAVEKFLQSIRSGY